MNEPRFGFGENWADYIEKNFSEERLEISKKHLLGFLKLPDLKGRTFLDIGCGSGLHSLAAHRAGAEKIISLDYDINSVTTTQYLHQYAGAPESWTILQGSVLDREFIDSLGQFDVVYSWGVLHHTGAMWEAIRNAAVPLDKNGVFYIALYTTDVYIRPTPEFWLQVKRRYNDSGIVVKRGMECVYACKNLFWPMLRQGQNPFKFMRDYKASRGMSYWHDIRDWLGGWPMEFAGLQETKTFCREELGLELLDIAAGEANTEYLFRKHGAQNYWDDYVRDKPLTEIRGPFTHAGGFAWSIELPELRDVADDDEHPQRSSLMLYENSEPLGFAHAPMSHVQAHGKSRYNHWEGELVFSATDNSDPNTNGRQYSYRIMAE